MSTIVILPIAGTLFQATCHAGSLLGEGSFRPYRSLLPDEQRVKKIYTQKTPLFWEHEESDRIWIPKCLQHEIQTSFLSFNKSLQHKCDLMSPTVRCSEKGFNTAARFSTCLLRQDWEMECKCLIGIYGYTWYTHPVTVACWHVYVGVFMEAWSTLGKFFREHQRRGPAKEHITVTHHAGNSFL